jgi:hypothetical protein
MCFYMYLCIGRQDCRRRRRRRRFGVLVFWCVGYVESDTTRRIGFML